MRQYYLGWNNVGATFVVHAISVGILIYGFSTLMIPVAHEYAMSRAQMQLCFSAMMLLSGIFSPIGAVLMEQISFRLLLIIGGALCMVGFTLVSSATSYLMIFLTFAVVFSVMELLLGPMTTGALLTRWFERRRGLAIGISMIGLSFGGAVAPPLIAWLVGLLGWHQTFIAIGLSSFFVIVILSAFVVRDRPDDHLKIQEFTNDPDNSLAAGRSTSNEYLSYGSLTRSGRLWTFSVIFGGANCAHSAIMLNFIPYATDVGFSLQNASFLAAAASIFGVISKIVMGIIADKVSYRLSLMLSLILLIVAPAILNLLGDEFIIMLIAAAFLGMALGGLNPVWGVMVSKEFGAPSFARAMGLMRVVAIPLGMLGPVVAGWMFDVFGDYRLAFWGVAAMDIVLIVLLMAAMIIFPPNDRGLAHTGLAS
jgi:MFS family permease